MMDRVPARGAELAGGSPTTVCVGEAAKRGSTGETWFPPVRGVILGIETSCDETAAALVTRDGRILANVVSSQAELHAPYGGVVPEVASRHHLELIVPALRRASTRRTRSSATSRPSASRRAPALSARS